jgi:hypothetical protein
MRRIQKVSLCKSLLKVVPVPDRRAIVMLAEEVTVLFNRVALTRRVIVPVFGPAVKVTVWTAVAFNAPKSLVSDQE